MERGGQYKVLKDDESELTKSFLDSFKNKLGPRAEEILDQSRDTILEQRQRLKESQKQLSDAEAILEQKDNEKQEILRLFDLMAKNDERNKIIQEQHGSNLEMQSEIERLKKLNKNYQTEIKGKKTKNIFA